jgi:magnesium chelatase family protein
MIARTYSATLLGVNALEVEIESYEATGQPKMVIVGLPDAAVKESRERVLAAIDASSLLRHTEGMITVNLAPADLRKEGPAFDLPIAISLIAHRSRIPLDFLRSTSMAGELALNGELRPVRGALSIALEARARGRQRILLPKLSAFEASAVKNIEVYGFDHLREVVDFLKGNLHLEPEPTRTTSLFNQSNQYDIDFSDVKGQHEAKRAMEIAVAGGHNMIMIGPPGTGKSMLAKRIITIMPEMSEEEALQTTKIHSAGGLLNSKNIFIATRPFRSPHHTISDAGLLGGGTNPGPGEVSLAHNGILFLDELPEFRRSTLDVMRQPLEDRTVTISRAAGSLTFPSDFMLIAAMNPCPCGYYGQREQQCRCSPALIQRYRQRISGPLLDRIDLHIEVPLLQFKQLNHQPTGESSSTIRQRITHARLTQQQRYQPTHPQLLTNSQMPSKLLKAHCKITSEASQLLEQTMSELHLSARAHDRILKVARTIADLETTPHIETHHLLEAIHFRTLDRTRWNL